MRLSVNLFVVLALLPATATFAQFPEPQYSVEDLKRSFAPATTEGMALAPDGSPQPRVQNTRAFMPIGSGAPKPTTRNLLITFANASAELTPQAMANARVVAKALQTPQLTSTRFAIDGHTNAVGSADYNRRLSRARAQALAKVLADNGVSRSRLVVNGFGFDRPYNAGNARAAENRRVEARRLN